MLQHCWTGDRKGIWRVKIVLQQSAEVLLWRLLWDTPNLELFSEK